MEINNAVELKEAIALLEKNVDFKKRDLIDQYHTTYESLKPANLIKNSVKKFAAKPGIVNKIVGVGAGIVVRKLIPGTGPGFIKKGVIAALRFTASKLNKKKKKSVPNVIKLTISKSCQPELVEGGLPDNLTPASTSSALHPLT
jgi:hypothetical protein